MPHRLSLAVVAATALAAGVSGCGGSKNTADQAVVPVAPSTISQTATTPPPTATTGTSTALSSTSTTTGTTTATTPAGAAAPLCTAGRLSLSYLGGQGATGHGELGFALRNTGSGPCRTYGFPGVTFLDARGNALQTVSQRTTRDFFGSVPETHLTLAPGQQASFRLGVTHVSSGGGSSCTTAAGLAVIPPDDTATLRVTIAGGSYECGTASVSPLASGTSVYP